MIEHQQVLTAEPPTMHSRTRKMLSVCLHLPTDSLSLAYCSFVCLFVSFRSTLESIRFLCREHDQVLEADQSDEGGGAQGHGQW